MYGKNLKCGKKHRQKMPNFGDIRRMRKTESNNKREKVNNK